MLNDIMLNVIMVNDVTLNVVAPLKRFFIQKWLLYEGKTLAKRVAVNNICNESTLENVCHIQNCFRITFS